MTENNLKGKNFYHKQGAEHYEITWGNSSLKNTQIITLSKKGTQ